MVVDVATRMVAIALYDVFIMFEYVIGLGLIGIGSNRIGRY